MGIATNRDDWSYNFSERKLSNNMQETVRFYNEQVDVVKNAKEKDDSIRIEDIIDYDPTKISWTSSLLPQLSKYFKARFQRERIYEATYRPFTKMQLYFGEKFVHRRSQFEELYPNKSTENYAICVSGIGSSKNFSSLITNQLSDLQLLANDQYFPLYWYEDTKKKEEKNKEKLRQKGGYTIDAYEQDMFDSEINRYIRHDGITDWILREVRNRYHASNITKEMIFYYVYGLLHSPDYRERFAADLKKSLPRIPIVEDVNDFMEFYKSGKKLADLHLNYEKVPAYPDCDVMIADYVETENYNAYDHFYVEKMRFLSKEDKSTIIYNGNIRIENIPAKAYEYVVNGKSAIEWIVERYCVSQDKKSLIKNDANDWAKEHGKPRYILDLLLSVINVSVQTVDIVKALPKLKFD